MGFYSPNRRTKQINDTAATNPHVPLLTVIAIDFLIAQFLSAVSLLNNVLDKTNLQIVDISSVHFAFINFIFLFHPVVETVYNE